MTIPILTPNEIGLITIDWDDVLINGVMFSGDVVHTLPSPLIKVAEGTDGGIKQSHVICRGGIHGALYSLTCTAALSNGETLVRQFPLRIWNGP